MIFLIGGVALIVAGINESHSFISDFSRIFTGTPNDNSRFMIGGGIASVLFGMFALFTPQPIL